MEAIYNSNPESTPEQPIEGGSGSLFGKRESYSINYSCQPKSWQPPQLASTECLSKEECKQLDDIIIKLLDNGVMLNIKYTPISEILGYPYESKGEAT